MSADPALEAIRSRSPEAVTALVRAHTQTLLAAALGLGLPQPDAEDLVAETFAAFLAAAGRFEGRSSVRTFLFGILYNKAKEAWRRRRREEPESEKIDSIFESRFDTRGLWIKPPAGPEAEAESAELARLITECAEGLSPEQRLAFHLREVEREGTAAACNILGVTPTHLGVLLFRARNKLRECLERRWGAKP